VDSDEEDSDSGYGSEYDSVVAEKVARKKQREDTRANKLVNPIKDTSGVVLPVLRSFGHRGYVPSWGSDYEVLRLMHDYMIKLEAREWSTRGRPRKAVAKERYDSYMAKARPYDYGLIELRTFSLGDVAEPRTRKMFTAVELRDRRVTTIRYMESASQCDMYRFSLLDDLTVFSAKPGCFRRDVYDQKPIVDINNVGRRKALADIKKFQCEGEEADGIEVAEAVIAKYDADWSTEAKEIKAIAYEILEFCMRPDSKFSRALKQNFEETAVQLMG
jgi:hypothetical protein